MEVDLCRLDCLTEDSQLSQSDLRLLELDELFRIEQLRQFQLLLLRECSERLRHLIDTVFRQF